jgi:glycosyltransferase involved in cell wall biosynthesis
MGKKHNKNKQPFVSICTPTFNRRPFFPYIIKCFEHQTYPRAKMEWIIIDDGTDKIEDIVTQIPEVKYFKFDEKMTLGKKRNIAHEKCSGDIIIYMDDDDYYPPERVSHAVEKLFQNPSALCAGSSEMFIYFKHIQQMYKFGPYGPNHATAATFAFRKELLNKTRYEDHACIAEEKKFLKDYTIPFVQLDSMKTILVVSHNHNSFDKKDLLINPSPFVTVSDKTVEDFIKESNIRAFFIEDVDKLLEKYKPGDPKNKPDVLKQLAEIKIKREAMVKQRLKEQTDYNNMMSKLNITSSSNQETIDKLNVTIYELTSENSLLKDKLKYYEDKIRQLVREKIEEKTASNTDVNR